jgi:D-glycero-D-manno-heptose 1,7-bisphosphate phosphatase
MVDQAVIIAGGLGTRLRPFTETNPKPMYPFGGKPFIEHLVLQIKTFGISEILILVGYLPEKIMDYLGDGQQFGVHIRYSVTPVEFETGERLLAALPYLEEQFLFLYCDNYCPVNFKRLVDDFERNDADIQFTAYSNRDKYTKDNLVIDPDGKVIVYDKKRVTEGLHGVDIGYAVIKRKVIEELPHEKINFEAYTYPMLIQKGTLFATVTEHRYYSVGSWERIELTKAFFQAPDVVFLDRDGTINERPPKACYVEKVQDFRWLDGAKEAIKKLKDHGYFVVLVSNQPGIARGNLTEDTLREIHRKMAEDLAEIGTKIDAIYYCPHNWDEGCFCRKPSPGMIFQAQKDFSLDLRKSVLFGDDERDIECAHRADIEGIQISDEYTLLQAVTDFIKRGKT